MTKLVFSCIEEFIGKVSNQDNFPFENLVGKKIALAEETAITSANYVDNYKTFVWRHCLREHQTSGKKSFIYVFSTIDLASGYHKVAMQDEDQEKTALTTPFRLW